MISMSVQVFPVPFTMEIYIIAVAIVGINEKLQYYSFGLPGGPNIMYGVGRALPCIILTTACRW